MQTKNSILCQIHPKKQLFYYCLQCQTDNRFYCQTCIKTHEHKNLINLQKPVGYFSCSFTVDHLKQYIQAIQSQFISSQNVIDIFDYFKEKLFLTLESMKKAIIKKLDEENTKTKILMQEIRKVYDDMYDIKFQAPEIKKYLNGEVTQNQLNEHFEYFIKEKQPSSYKQILEGTHQMAEICTLDRSIHNKSQFHDIKDLQTLLVKKDVLGHLSFDDKNFIRTIMKKDLCEFLIIGRNKKNLTVDLFKKKYVIHVIRTVSQKVFGVFVDENQTQVFSLSIQKQLSTKKYEFNQNIVDYQVMIIQFDKDFNQFTVKLDETISALLPDQGQGNGHSYEIYQIIG